MLLDIGDTELAAGLSYVGASRSNHPRCYCVHPFPTEARFSRIGALTSNKKEDAKQRAELQHREAACQQLGRLARQTIAANQELYEWCAAHCNGGREGSGKLAAADVVLVDADDRLEVQAGVGLAMSSDESSESDSSGTEEGSDYDDADCD